MIEVLLMLDGLVWDQCVSTCFHVLVYKLAILVGWRLLGEDNDLVTSLWGEVLNRPLFVATLPSSLQNVFPEHLRPKNKIA